MLPDWTLVDGWIVAIYMKEGKMGIGILWGRKGVPFLDWD
jgi:hypothetical protein